MKTPIEKSFRKEWKKMYQKYRRSIWGTFTWTFLVRFLIFLLLFLIASQSLLDWLQIETLAMVSIGLFCSLNDYIRNLKIDLNIDRFCKDVVQKNKKLKELRNSIDLSQFDVPTGISLELTDAAMNSMRRTIQDVEPYIKFKINSLKLKFTFVILLCFGIFHLLYLNPQENIHSFDSIYQLPTRIIERIIKSNSTIKSESDRTQPMDFRLGKNFQSSGKRGGYQQNNRYTLIPYQGVVPIPGENEYNPPQQFRQEIIKSLNESYPKSEETLIKSYFRRITE